MHCLVIIFTCLLLSLVLLYLLTLILQIFIKLILINNFHNSLAYFIFLIPNKIQQIDWLLIPPLQS